MPRHQIAGPTRDDSHRQTHPLHHREQRHLSATARSPTGVWSRSTRALTTPATTPSATPCSWRPPRRAHFPPISRSRTPLQTIEHEAITSKIGEDQLFYLAQRGLSEEDAVNRSSPGSARTCSGNSRWSSPSRHRSCLVSAWSIASAKGTMRP